MTAASVTCHIAEGNEPSSFLMQYSVIKEVWSSKILNTSINIYTEGRSENHQEILD